MSRWGDGRPQERRQTPQERRFAPPPSFRPTASWRARSFAPPPSSRPPRRTRPSRSPHHYSSSYPPSPRPPTPTHPYHIQPRPPPPPQPITASHRPATPQRPPTPQRPMNSAPMPSNGVVAGANYAASTPYVDHRNVRVPMGPTVATPDFHPRPSTSLPPNHHRPPNTYGNAPSPAPSQAQRYANPPRPTFTPIPAAPIPPPQPCPPPRPADLRPSMPTYSSGFRPTTPPRIQVEVNGSQVTPRAPRAPPLNVTAASAPAPAAPPQPQTPPAPPAPGGDAAFMAPTPTAAPTAPMPAAAPFPPLRSKPLPQKSSPPAQKAASPPTVNTPAVPAPKPVTPTHEESHVVLDLEIGGSKSVVLLERKNDVYFVGVTQMDASPRVVCFTPTNDAVEVLVGPTDTTTEDHMQCVKRIARALDAQSDDEIVLSVAIADVEIRERWVEVSSAVEQYATLRKQGKV